MPLIIAVLLAKHQADTLGLLNYNKGYNMIMLRNTRCSLNDLQRALNDEVNNLRQQNAELLKRVNAPRTRKSTNEKRLKTVKANNAIIDRLVDLMIKWNIKIDLSNTIVGEGLKQLKREVSHA